MKKKEENLLTKEQAESAVAGIKTYLEENFDIEIGGLEVRMFLDYLSENIGPYYYNKGVADSFSFISEKVEDMYALMKAEK